ncbi:MAG: response regulator [Deltaproteobacteria bacterium]|nr:response regulator [Deltaproteobacteria bacterium]
MTQRNNVILIVDDEPDMCWALEYILNKRGYVTCKALSAQEALELMAQQQFACAFLDAKLPDMDGLELGRLIRERAPDMRILMVSGYFYRDDVSIQEAIARGVIIDLISKPFLQAEILRVLET